MAFSLRSFFGKDKPDDRQAGSSSMTSSPQAHQGGYPFQKSHQTGTYSTKDVFLGASTPANGHSGSYQGGSPFSPAVSVPSTGLTVEDILPFMPPDVVKAGAVAPGQPLQIANDLLERALRSGQGALPLFEIYRVCPAIFRTPISPHDARMVALPHHKLGGLAAFVQTNPPPAAATPAPQNPFAAGNPFHQAAEPPAGAASGETTLFHPSPFHFDGSMAPAEPSSQQPETPSPVPPSTVQPSFAGFGALQAPAPAGGERTDASLPPSIAGNPFAPSPAVTTSTTSPFAPQAGQGGLFAPAGPPGQSTPVFGSANQESMPPVPAFFGTAPPPEEPAAPAPPATGGTASAPVPLFTFGMPSPVSAPAPAVPAGPGPFGSFLPEVPAEPPPSAEPAPGPAPLQNFGQGNPFFQVPASTSGSTGAPPVPAANPFASFGQPAAPVMPASSGPALPPAAPLEATPWQAMTAAAPPAGEPQGLFPEAPAATATSNPFDRIKALASAPEVASQPAPAPMPVTVPASSPLPAPVPAAPGTLFGPGPGMGSHPAPTANVMPSPAFVAPPAPPAFVPAPNSPAPASEKATFSLATVLSRCSEMEIGVKPEQIPSWISVSFPVSTLVEQLASGKVSVKLAEIMRGLEPEFRSIITPSRPDIVVELPINDVFHALPSGVTPAEVPPVASQPLSLPLPGSVPATAKTADILGTEALAAMADLKPTLPAGSPESQAALPSLFALAKPEDSTAKLPAGVPWPFEVTPAKPEPAPAAPENPPSFFGTPTAAEDPPAVTPPFHLAPRAEPVLAPEPPALFQATSTLLGIPSTPAPRTIRPEAITFGPGVKAEITPASPVKHSRDRNKQLLLRVLLSTEDDMELDDVIRLTGALPGVSAAVCLQQGIIVGSATNGSSEAQSFVRQATQIYGHLQPLIQLTGIMDTETLSMKSDQLMASFSLQGDLVLGVLHDPGKNEPTLRERITLIARELKTVVSAAP